MEPQPDPADARASCQYQPKDLSTIDPEVWASMSEIERARAVLRMHGRDSEAYYELRMNFEDCRG